MARWSVKEVRLNSQGYEFGKWGGYYGRGERLFRAHTDDDQPNFWSTIFSKLAVQRDWQRLGVPINRDRRELFRLANQILPGYWTDTLEFRAADREQAIQLVKIYDDSATFFRGAKKC